MSLTSLYPQTSGYRTPVNSYPQQFPGMQLNMPLGLFQPQQQQPDHELIGLHGLDSAKQYPMKPNTTVPTFDMDSDHAFILNADANGAVSVKILRFKVVSEEEYRKAIEAEAPVQLQRSEYNDLLGRMKKLEEELEDAKQSIRANGTGGTKPSATKPSAKPSVAVSDSDV